jgi:hypothetical protein
VNRFRLNLLLLASLVLLILGGCGPPSDPYVDRPPCTQAIGPVAGCDPGIGRRLGSDND